MGEIPNERRFTDREIREILKRATETRSSGPLASGQDLSLNELKAIGREVGIDPVRLETAAREVAQQDGPPSHGVLGVSTKLHAERRLEGTIDQTRVADIASVVRRAMGKHGTVNHLGEALEWSAVGQGIERSVTVSSSKGTLTIEGSTNLTDAVKTTYLTGGLLSVVLMVIGVSFGIDEESIGMIVLSMVLLPAAYLGLRTVLRRVSESESAKLQRAVEDVVQLKLGSGD